MFKLRELDKKDIAIINECRNDPELISYLGAPYRFINVTVDENWYNSYMANRGNQIRCAIVNDNDTILGLVSLTNIDYINSSAEFHIMIGNKSAQNSGVGSFAINSMLSHAFLNMNLQRIELSVLVSNKRAIHVYEKMGFVYEGTKRNCCYKEGKFTDMHIYSVLRSEWTEVCGGGVLLPTHCIKYLDSDSKIRQVVRKMNKFFRHSLYTDKNFENTLCKIVSCANVVVAYNIDVIGMVAFYANDYVNKISYITLIVTDIEYQNKGIATELFNICEYYAKSKGMKSLNLEVWKDNLNAIAFYKNKGMHFLEKKSESSYFMAKLLY